MRSIGHFPLLVLVLGLSACASHPAPSVKSDPQAAPESSVQQENAATEKSAGEITGPAAGYRVESEGEAPVTKDVEFEEDRLPPSPEEVEATKLESERVSSSEVEQLPKVQGAATPDSGGDKIPPSVSAPVDPSVKIPIEGKRPAARLGFRVQIAASRDKSNAEEVARQARSRIPETVYVVFESPYYKVRVGDFSDRALALQLRDRLRGYGYDEAWVVTTTVMESAKDSGS
jgi:hypothetical protein